jgi:dihydrofolate reductase
MSKIRIHNFSISIDGYGAGPNQNMDNPLGVGGLELHNWMFKTASFHKMIGEAGGAEGIDNDFVARGDVNIGAWILGRNMFGPIRGEWPDDAWKGWWGENPSSPSQTLYTDGRRNYIPFCNRRYPCCIGTGPPSG